MLRIQGLIIFSIVYTLLIAAAIIMPSYKWSAVAAGIVVTALLILRERQNHIKKVENIHKRLSNLRSEGLFLNEEVKFSDPDVFYRLILTLLTDLERSLFKLVEKNIQLLSLKEIGRNIISSLDENKLIDSVFEYLVHGVGYREAAFVFLRKKKQCFQAVVCIENVNRMIRRVINIDLKNIDGVLRNSFVSGKAFLIKDARMHPMFDSGEVDLFPGSTMTSYICVPLLKSSERNLSCRHGKCARESAENETAAERRISYLSDEECLSCPDNPLLGAVIVTDGYRATPLTNIDQVTIETVGSLVASNIENWMLYQELRQEEIFREKVFEGMQHGLFVTDLQGQVTLANRSALEMSLVREDEVKGRNISELIAEDVERSGIPVLQLILSRENPSVFHEAYLKRTDGFNIPIRMYISNLIGNDGEIQGAILLFTDQSEIIRMEEEIRHLDRLAVLGRFTSAIAHEIRNPLTGIAAGIQYLQRRGGLSEEQKENITFILNEVDRLNRIITDLFKIAKPRDLLYQKVSMRELVERSFKSVGELLNNRNIEFGIETDGDLPQVEVDPDQIMQVLINLMKNAAEAIDDNGRISVRVNGYCGGDPEVMRQKDREMICIEVADTGQGIEKRDMEKLFEPFFSKKIGGTGLGLFVTHSIIQHHQGRIGVSSVPGEGSTFRVYLPIARPAKGGKVETGSASGR